MNATSTAITQHFVETDQGEKIFTMIPGETEDPGRAYIIVCAGVESFFASSRFMAEVLIQTKLRAK
jgi:hypothetical protein